MHSTSFDLDGTNRIKDLARNLLSCVSSVALRRRIDVKPGAERGEQSLRREQVNRAARARTDLLLKAHHLG